MDIVLYNNEVDDLYLKKGDSSVRVKESIDYLMEGNMTEILYDDLVGLRDASGLTPGRCYRITDYECAVSECWVKSAGHQFDIIVTALTENTLSEQASAARHEGDEYFSGATIESWKLWYSLDNDVNKMYYANPISKISLSSDEKSYYLRDVEDDVEGTSHPYCWTDGKATPTKIYTDTEVVDKNDYVYSESSSETSSGQVERYYPKGKGVIYRLIDEWENDVSYDFKNIMFRRYQSDVNGYLLPYSTDSTFTGVYYKWFYTFCVSNYNVIDENNSGTDAGGDISLRKLLAFNNILTIKEDKFDIVMFVLNTNLDRFRDNVFLMCNTITIGRQAYENYAYCSNLFVRVRTGSSTAFRGNRIFRSTLEIKSVILDSQIVSSTIRQTSTTGLCQRINMYNSTISAQQIQYTKAYNSTITAGTAILYSSFNEVSAITINSAIHKSVLSNSNGITFENVCSGVTMEGCEYVTVTSSNSANTLCNLTFNKGIKGTTGSPKIISHDTSNDDFLTVYQPQNSVTVGVS